MEKIKLVKQKKVALFFPWIKSKGGAERALLEILDNSKHKIDVYTWIYDKENSLKNLRNLRYILLLQKS